MWHRPSRMCQVVETRHPLIDRTHYSRERPSGRVQGMSRPQEQSSTAQREPAYPTPFASLAVRVIPICVTRMMNSRHQPPAEFDFSDHASSTSTPGASVTARSTDKIIQPRRGVEKIVSLHNCYEAGGSNAPRDSDGVSHMIACAIVRNKYFHAASNKAAHPAVPQAHIRATIRRLTTQAPAGTDDNRACSERKSNAQIYSNCCRASFTPRLKTDSEL